MENLVDSKIRILLVDDCEDTLMLLSTILEREGAQISTAHDGEECLDLAIHEWEDQHPFDIILLDLQMPKLSGFETIRELRRKGYPLPVIAMTARSAAADEDECMKLGCNAFVSKFAGKNTICEVLKEHAVKRLSEADSELPVLPTFPKILDQNPEYAPSVLKFLRELPQALADIKVSLHNGDLEEVKRISLLGGKSSLFGYPALTECFKDIQIEACQKSKVGIQKTLPMLERAIRAAIAGKKKIKMLVK